ncbi:universal stress protein [Sporichthya polymorpha]|uniref:universal stress protein n=1 Tax=Sporichthya polymorpha TaxID=35751 RepID=UPI00036C5839|nr:universal stress protein [Sporichthya polymorpha]
MTGQIVVGVDGTDGGRRALTWALRHAGTNGARVLAAAVYYDPAALNPAADPGRAPSPRAQAARRDAERHLANDVAAVRAWVPEAPPVDTIVVPGDVIAHALTALAEGADLLVVGSHGHGVVTSRVLGTVSMGCVTSAPCPVLVVPARDRHVPADETATDRPLLADRR